MDLVSLAIARMASPIQEQAQQVLHLSAAGFGTTEIGSQLAMTRGQVSETQRLVGDSLFRVLVEEEGYSPAEAIRTLRVPSAIAVEAMPRRYPELARRVNRMFAASTTPQHVAESTNLTIRAVRALRSLDRPRRAGRNSR